MKGNKENKISNLSAMERSSAVLNTQCIHPLDHFSVCTFVDDKENEVTNVKSKYMFDENRDHYWAI